MLLFKKRTNGYTLIELLVVIAIIGITAISVMTIYGTQQQKARDSIRMSDISQLKSLIEEAYSNYDEYPRPIEFNTIISQFISEIPSDPMKPEEKEGKDSQYRYTYGTSYNAETFVSGQEFELSAYFEYRKNKPMQEEDLGNDEHRYEEGWNTPHINTNLPKTGNTCLDSNNHDFSVGASGDCVIIGE